jgi:hypothetical protein
VETANEGVDIGTDGEDREDMEFMVTPWILNVMILL